MLGLALRTDHSEGSFRLEIYKQSDGDLSLCVYDTRNRNQFDFELSSNDAEDFLFLLQRAIDEKPGRREDD